jgi:hypothetical protein
MHGLCTGLTDLKRRSVKNCAGLTFFFHPRSRIPSVTMSSENEVSRSTSRLCIPCSPCCGRCLVLRVQNPALRAGSFFLLSESLVRVLVLTNLVQRFRNSNHMRCHSGSRPEGPRARNPVIGDGCADLPRITTSSSASWHLRDCSPLHPGPAEAPASAQSSPGWRGLRPDSLPRPARLRGLVVPFCPLIPSSWRRPFFGYSILVHSPLRRQPHINAVRPPALGAPC